MSAHTPGPWEREGFTEPAEPLCLPAEPLCLNAGDTHNP